jgi:RNA polymerase sigma-70 factor (ECF subfamily)
MLGDRDDGGPEPLVDRAYRYALALSHDPSEAEELVQDAYLALLETDDRRHLGCFLRFVRRRFFAAHPREALVLIDAAEDDALPPELDDVLLTASLSLDKALTALRAEEREALYLAAVEGYDPRAIAELQGRPVGAVVTLMARACQKLLAAAQHASTRSGP